MWISRIIIIEFPSEKSGNGWNGVEVSSLQKRRDYRSDNYRVNALLCSAGKVYTEILEVRLKPYAKKSSVNTRAALKMDAQ